VAGARSQIDYPRISRLLQSVGEKRGHTGIRVESGGIERQIIGQEIAPHGGKPWQLVELEELGPIHTRDYMTISPETR
jgi:hypothetical protein